jgi:crossover junction endodeoxyribonuclease RuvC
MPNCENKLELISFGHKYLHEKELPGRLKELKEKIDELLDYYEPDLVAVERPVSFFNGDTTVSLISYYGLVIGAAVSRGIEVIECRPTTVKKFITGHGNADKLEVAEEMQKRFGIMLHLPQYTKRDHKLVDYLYDESDATGLAYYAYNKKKEGIKNE